MKFKIHLILLTTLAFLISGCYTQLQYSQGINRITDEPRPQGSGTYSWGGDEEAKPSKTGEQPTEYEVGYEDGYVDGIDDAYYYKDYKVADWYARHGFSTMYGFPHHYGFPRWRHYSTFHNPYYHRFYPRTYASLSFSFGSFGAFYGFPYSWHRYRQIHFWDPYYGYGYGPTFVYNNIYYHGGYAKYIGPDKRDKDRKYGRRTTVGTNRVGSGYTRDSGSNTNTIRSRDRDTNTSVKNKTRGTNTIRTRGTTRVNTSRGTTRSGSDNGRVRSTGRSGQDGNNGRNNGDTNRRSRGGNDSYNVSSIDRNDDSSTSRARSYEEYRNALRNSLLKNRSRVINRIENSRAPDVNFETPSRKRSSSFGNRLLNSMQKSLDNSSIRNRINSNSNNNNSSTRSSVRTRSNSSSSSNRGNVSRSRSSSGGGNSSDGSSSRRSRGNNN
ncbi:MAG: hypothetical protein U5K69_08890 [Balneolaceae bacterium]|nr:hypothetical protein [Balneolaceae bacterium]